MSTSTKSFFFILKQSIKGHGRIFLLISVVLLAVYLPTTLSNYMHHDDYWMLDIAHITKSGDKDCRDTKHYYGLYRIGRPLAGETMCTAVPFLLTTTDQSIKNTYNFYKYMRGLSLFCLIVSFFLFSASLKSRLIDNNLALAIPALIFFLPGAGVYIGWAVMGIYAPGFVFLGLSVLFSSILFSEKESQKKELAKLSALSILFLVISFNFHQGVGFIYLALPMLLLAFHNNLDWNTLRLRVWLQIGIFFASSLFYFLIQKFLVLKLVEANITGTEKRTFELSSLGDILERLNIFFMPNRSFFWRASNLWVLDPINKFSHYIIGIILSAALAGLIIWLVKFSKKEIADPKRDIAMGFEKGVFILIILSLCGSLAILNQLVPHFRVLYGFSAAVAILFIWAARFWIYSAGKLMGNLIKLDSFAVFNGFIIILVIFSGLKAQNNTYKYYAVMSSNEMAYFESKVVPLLKGESDGLYLIRPKGNLLVGGDEFSMQTSYFPAYYGVAGMFKMVLRKYGSDPRNFKIKAPRRENYAFFYKEGPLKKVDIINMQEFNRSRLIKTPITTLNLTDKKAS